MKKYLFPVGMFLIYFVIVFACEFLGFLSPLLWVYFGVLAALLAAAPVMAAASKSDKIGTIALFPIIYLLIMLLLGEVSQPIVFICVILVSILAEVVRKLVGSKKQLSLRLGYAVAALAPGMYLLPLWTKTDWYYEGAVEEMGSQAYADSLMKFATPLGLIALIVLCFAVGYLGALIAERLFKNKVRIAL